MKKSIFLIFLAINNILSFSQNNLTKIEYWFNNDFSLKKSITISPSQVIDLNLNIQTTDIPNGINTINLRILDNNGLCSSPISQFFFKLPSTSFTPSNITAYQYWINNNFNQATTIQSSPQQIVNINELINLKYLNDGLNIFNIRFKDDKGLWSSPISQFFYKIPPNNLTTNQICGYKYWFDNNIDNSKEIILSQPTSILNLSTDIDLTRIWKGKHTIHFQFKDLSGMWSTVITDTIEKLSLPLPLFTYTTDFYCDSSVIKFKNNSIDAHIFQWDFGDGHTSNEINPQHTYLPGIYNITLSAKDTSTNKDSTIVIPIKIGGHSYFTLNISSCKSYISPSGKYIWSKSGTYNDTITNFYGCDSIITTNLNIITVNKNVIQNNDILTAEASNAIYQWLDCKNNFTPIQGEINQTFKPTIDGTYAVQITQNGCVDTSDCFIVVVSKISENSLKEIFKIYPNPTNNFINIENNLFNNSVKVYLKDISGKIIKIIEIQKSNHIIINMEDYPAGLYILEIKDTKEQNTTKIKIVKY